MVSSTCMSVVCASVESKCFYYYFYLYFQPRLSVAMSLSAVRALYTSCLATHLRTLPT